MSLLPNWNATIGVVFEKFDIILLSTALSITLAYLYLTISQYEKQIISSKAKIDRVILSVTSNINYNIYINLTNPSNIPYMCE